MAIYTALNGAMRLYDSTATPFYLALTFENADLSAPTMRPRPEETNVMHRGRASATTCKILGDDSPILDPMELSFSFKMQNSVAIHGKLMAALSNPYQASPWLVGSDTWVTTKGDGLLTNGDGTGSVPDPAFADTLKKAVDLCIIWTRDAVVMGFRYFAVYFPPDQITFKEAEDSITYSVKGEIHGHITAITAFPAGNAS